MQTNDNTSVEAGGDEGEQLRAAQAGNGAGPAGSMIGGADETLAGWAREMKRRKAAEPSGLPLLPAAPGDDEIAAAADLAKAVASFHRGDVAGGSGLEKPGENWVPALLHPFRDPSAVRNDYPLFLFAADAGADARLAAPVAAVLRETIESFAPGNDDARILKDNLARLERRVRERVGGALSVEAAATVGEAAQALIADLALSGDNRVQLEGDVGRLAAALPRGGALLSLAEQTPLVLFTHAAHRRALLRRSELGKEIGKLRHKLDDLLRVDRGKDQRPPDALKGAVGATGAAHVDSEALSRILGPARGAQRMDAERRKRIEGVVAALDRYLGADLSLMTVVAAAAAPAGCEGPGVSWKTVAAGDVCAAAVEAFDAQAGDYAQLYSAVRVARLELAGAYDPARHDSLVKGFGWDAFTADELTSLPPVVALESADELAGAGMVSLSRLLLSGRPVEVLVTVRPAVSPGAAAGADPAAGFRFELGYLGLGHREALVHQSSAARPAHLIEGFLRSVAATRASLHVIAGGLNSDGGAPRLGAWLYGGAALEGRAHPFFHYDPEAGASWAKRLDFEGNPSPEEDWPVYELPCRAADGGDRVLSLAFTFADFALLDPAYGDHFRVIPPAVAGEELVALDEYLKAGAELAAGLIPFIWSVDEQGKCRRLALSRALAAACRDRLSYWQTLQELAGVRNEHVHEAVAAERERLEAEFAAERERLAAERDEAVAEAVAAAAGQAMQKLAETLLNTDVGALAVAPSRPARPAQAPGAPAAAGVEAPAEEPAQAAAEPEDEGTEEAWIDSVLCTTCNDCINMNNRLFTYNANKQAIIGDVSAGTYAELVVAAEKCPSNCIHPGKPLNADEPDLEALVKRAARYN